MTFQPPYRIVFMGCPDFALPGLQHIMNDPAFQIVGVYSMCDKPKGRGQKSGVTPVKEWALEKGLPVSTPVSFRKDPEAVESLRALRPDFLVVVAYGMILPEAVLVIPRIAAVNLHASLLPKYRGPSPIHHALLNGDAETGNTIMLMNARMDEGDMLAQGRLAIAETDTLASLHDRLSREGAVLLVDTLKKFAAGSIQPIPQNHANATYTKKIAPDLARIDWNKDSRCLKNLLRAMTPCPGSWFELNGERIKVGTLLEGPRVSGKPGQVLTASPQEGILVACSNGTSVRLKSLQRPGKSMMAVGDFLRGFQGLSAGLILS